MNAAHPNATPSEPGEARVPEPSMEEILASIRRIIADDQSLPDHAVSLRESLLRDVPTPRPSPETPVARDPEEASPAAIHVLRPDIPSEPSRHAPEQDVATSRPPAPHPAADEARAPRAEGPIAAPQFASPHGPQSVPSQETARMVPTDPPSHLGSEPPPGPARDLDDVRAYREDARADIPPAADSEPDVFDSPLGYTPSKPGAESPASLFSAATDQSVVSAFNVLAATRLADNSDELLAMTRDMIRPILKDWLDDNLPSLVERLVRAEIERVSRGGR